MSNLTKPQPKQHRPAYDYGEIADFIEKKYAIKLRGYKNEEDGEYRDFWHFLVDRCQIHRGCYITVSEETGDGAEEWQKELLSLFLTEFGSSIYIWVDW